MSLLFNTLSMLVITFLPRSKPILISWQQAPSAVILELPKIKSVTVFIVSLSICHEVMGLDAVILVFWMLSFKPTFSLSSSTFIKLLFSFSLSAIRVVPSVYLRLLIFLPAIWIPACTSSSLAFCMMYSAYKLNKSEVTQSCPTLCDPMDTRLLRPWDFLGKSTGVGCHFLLQGTSRPRDRTQVSYIVDKRFTVWATRDVSVQMESPWSWSAWPKDQETLLLLWASGFKNCEHLTFGIFSFCRIIMTI